MARARRTTTEPSLRILDFLTLVHEGVAGRLGAKLDGFDWRQRFGYLQYYRGKPDVHYEVWVQRKTQRLEIGLHFEGPDRERNYECAEALAIRGPDVQRAIGPEYEMEEWTKVWTRLHRSFDAPSLTPALADDAAAKVVALIRGMEPIIDQMELREMIDCHTHLQPHGQAPPMTIARIEEYVRVAETRGIERVCITEHLFRFAEAYTLLYGWWDDDPDATLAGMVDQYWQDHVSGSIADYVRVVEDAKRAGLPVLLGLEMDWIHGRADVLRKFLAPYDWDIVLGSVHYIGAWGFDDTRFLDEWKKRDVAGAWADYGSLVRELAMSGLVDVLAHPDLPKVYGHRPADESPLHEAILEGASVNGTAIELNSNGLRKRCKEIYPAMPLLRRARELDLPITLASDAHTPERVGANFDDLVVWARSAGYAEASYFEARRRRAYSLPADAHRTAASPERSESP